MENIFEMNAKPEPEWSIKFKKYLEEECQIDEINAVCIIGKLHSIIRQYKTSINEAELDRLAVEYTLANPDPDTTYECQIEAYTAGCNEMLKRLS